MSQHLEALQLHAGVPDLQNPVQSIYQTTSYTFDNAERSEPIRFKKLKYLHSDHDPRCFQSESQPREALRL